MQEPWQANRAAAFRGKKALVLPAKTLPIALVVRKTARLGMTPKEKAHRVKVAVKRRESQWRVSPRNIEKANRCTQHIFVPDDWCTLVKKARRNNPFHVTKMEMGDFVSVQIVRSTIVYQKVDVNKQKVDWLSIRWLRFSKEHPLEIYFRYSHNTLEAWKILDVYPRRQGRPSDVGRTALVPLYTSQRCIKDSKIKDLKSLMD